MAEILTTKEYAKMHGASHRLVLRAIRQGRLPATLIRTSYFILANTICVLGEDKRHCVKCGNLLPHWKHKYCSRECWPIRYIRHPRPENPKLVMSLAIRESNPCATLQQVADKVGCTRERVRQLLLQSNHPTRHYKPPVNKFYCMACGIPTPKPLCPKCTQEQRYVPVACTQCGKLSQRHLYRLLQGLRAYPNRVNLFCSKHCQGKWLAEKHGFKTGYHPTHPPIPRKYDYDAIWQKHLDTGYGSTRLARLLNINQHSVSSILKICHKRSLSSH